MSTTSVLSALFALCLSTAHPAAAKNGRSLVVDVNMAFDQSITSNYVREYAKQEAAAIWAANGVELEFCEHGQGALQLDVYIARGQRELIADHQPAVLGRTMLDAKGETRGPIRISVERVEKLLEMRQGANPALYDLDFARTLGRVLAHEIGHVLLGAHHDPAGLMRPTFNVGDLAAVDPVPFRLAPEGTARLRERIDRILASGF